LRPCPREPLQITQGTQQLSFSYKTTVPSRIYDAYRRFLHDRIGTNRRSSSMAVIAEALLWLFVVISGIAVGAGLYEMRVNLPRWFTVERGTVIRVNLDAIRSDDSGRRFWALVTTGPLTLLTLAGFVAAWPPDTIRRQWWFAAAGMMFVERIATFGFFIPQLLKLLREDDMQRATRVARTWMRLNYARAALAFAAWMTAIRALTTL